MKRPKHKHKTQRKYIMVTYTDKLIREHSKYSDLAPLSAVVVQILDGYATVTERLCRVVCEAIFS